MDSFIGIRKEVKLPVWLRCHMDAKWQLNDVIACLVSRMRPSVFRIFIKLLSEEFLTSIQV